MMKSSPGNSIIVLKAGRQKKIYLVFVSVLFIVMALVLVLSFPGIAKVVVPMFGFLLLIVIVGGLVDTSKGARITLTSSSISGGTLRQKTIPWDKLGDIRIDHEDEVLIWEYQDSWGSKPNSCKTPYGPLGRECLHNGRSVSRTLASEWIKALRDATSGREREELLEKFSREPPVSLRPLDELSPEEHAKADEALQQFKEMTGGEHTRMEVRQYFQEKGWIFPQQKIWTPKVVIGCLMSIIMIGLFLYTIIQVLIFKTFRAPWDLP